MVRFFSFFFKIFFSFLVFIFSFLFVFSENLSSSSSSSVLESVRGVIWDLANDVYLYETVLFDPSDFFVALENEDVVLKNNSININLNSSNFVKTKKVSGNSDIPELSPGVIPKQLFDITFNLHELEISDLRDLVGVLTFENFGSEPIPVDVSFEVLDFNSNVVLSGKFDEVVGTEESVFIFFRDYGSFDFVDGEYSVVLTSLYGDGVEDDFEQNFVFVSSDGSRGFVGFVVNYWIYFVGFFVLLFSLFLVFRFVFVSSEDLNQVHSFEEMDNFSNLNLENGVENIDLESENCDGIESNSDDLDFVDENFDENEVLIDDDFEDLETFGNSDGGLDGVKK